MIFFFFFLILIYTTCLDICVFGASHINRLTMENLKSGLQFIELKLILDLECIQEFFSKTLLMYV